MSDENAVLKGHLSESEVAAQLGKCVRTLRNWARRGYGPPRVRIGRSIYYRLVEVSRWIDSLGRLG
ncbi:MAG: helix-turn-helix domain-containing protein [Dokdonella sp.]|nr:helix-turn-helix domain-containing protein [Dokdonella sp.]